MCPLRRAVGFLRLDDDRLSAGTRVDVEANQRLPGPRRD